VYVTAEIPLVQALLGTTITVCERSVDSRSLECIAAAMQAASEATSAIHSAMVDAVLTAL
jgi:hypothetical protein